MERDNVAIESIDKASEQSVLISQAKEILPLTGGANNRVFKIVLPEDTLILKSYFHHPKDPRDRLSTEYDFLSFLWEEGQRSIPQPLEKHPAFHIGIYSCLQGSKATFPIEKKFVHQALDFFLQINTKKEKAIHLPNASEACFSLRDYIYAVDRRIETLLALTPSTSLEKEIVNFISTTLFPYWEKRKKELPQSEESLPKNERVITPSDFGFHNILIDDKGQCLFLDFEYAGWDDPIKTFSDLFLQPKIQISEKYIPWALDYFLPHLSHPEKGERRFHLVFSICQIKWLCIMLNSFTELGKKRRAFSQSLEESTLYAEFQLVREKFYQLKEA